ncbi:MAG TPA: PEP-CTERM sorting domain-containing protein [Pirellulales bacterium]|nr:PEP-CTERM sorting domain-containing protein [Pirellulales bacterium]
MTQTVFATTFQPPSQQASASATIQTTGPRGGSGGANSFNLLGSSNTSGGAGLPSFGVTDFNFSALQPTLGGTVTNVSNISLQLTQFNNSFSSQSPTSISVYFTANNAATSGLKDANSQSGGPYDGSASVDSTLNPLSFVGSYNFSAISSGTLDTISLSSFSGNALSSFVSDLNSGSTMRLLLTADNSAAVATYAASGNSNSYAGPTLTFTVTTVPEPAAFVLAGLSLLGLVATKKLHHKSLRCCFRL